MGKILIISATNDNNLVLSKELKLILSKIQISVDVISLEDLKLPLFSSEASLEVGQLDKLLSNLEQCNGIIICSPEYNGGVPPVLSNAITWVTVKSNNWRDAFNGKFALIATYSGGEGSRLINSLRGQLEYMGTNVLARTISVNKNKPLDPDSAKRILQGLVDIIS